MKLTKIALERTRDAHPPLPPVTEQLVGLDRKAFFPFIWEPQNRSTFTRADLDERMARDTLPLPAEIDRDYYFENLPVEYWVSGLTDYLKVVEILESHGRPIEGLNYLDMGCCSGRVLRHMALQNPGSRAYGCDLNAQAIHWIHRYLPDVPAFQNHALPHLPLPDNSLDCITAFSVFTHIDEFEEAWLLELRRILKPGGLALISNHGDAVWHAINPDHFIYPHLERHQSLNDLAITPELFEGPIPDERVAYYTGQGEANRINMFRSDAHVRRHWSRFLPVIDILPRGHLFHDLVVLQKEA